MLNLFVIFSLILLNSIFTDIHTLNAKSEKIRTICLTLMRNDAIVQ